MDSEENDFYYVFKYGNNSFYVNNDLVYCFGTNKDGELGLGHNEKVTEWTIIPALCKKQIIEFNDGLSYCTALSKVGKVYTFGLRQYNQLGNEEETMKSDYIKPKTIEALDKEFITQISCGVYHTLVLTRNREVYGWGNNKFGQIGINNEEITQSIAVKIKGFNGEKIKSICCGSFYSMSLTMNGNVFSWGHNSCGQLGINSTEDSYLPQMIKFGDKTMLFDEITCGGSHSLLLSKTKDIYSFGSNDYYQLGYKTYDDKHLIPQKIEMKSTIKFCHVFCQSNGAFSTALTFDDKLCYIWGKCGVKGVIETPENTEFKSCKQAVNSFLKKDFPLNKNDSKIVFKDNYFENTFNEIQSLGSGSYGEVFKAKNKVNKNSFAIKKIILSENHFKDGIVWREIEFLSTLKSAYVVEYENAWIETNKQTKNGYVLHIKMELCSETLKAFNAKLFKELQCQHSLVKNLIGLNIISEILREVIEGVNYLHKNNIIHRDLKPSNILISDFKNGRIVRIADFGISCIHRHENNEEIGISHTGEVGDIKYMAPELFVCGRSNYSYKVDIYSLGIISNELTLGNNCLSIELFDDSLKSKLQSWKQIISKMRNNRPKERPDCEELLKDINENYIISLDLNEYECICDNLKKFDSEYNCFYIKYIVNKLYYQILCDKIIQKTITSLFSNILGLPIFESYHNGKEHCIARTVDGKLYSFGSNQFSQLGYQTEKDYNCRPKRIESLINENVIQVYCGAIHTVILTENGEIYTWGDNRWSQIGNSSSEYVQSVPIKLKDFNNEIIKSVCCGDIHSMALTANGNVYSWGYNYSGQLGLEIKIASMPKKITGFNGEKVKSISCGYHHSMALTNKGNVFGWGRNNWGQLGLKNNSDVFNPKVIKINDLKILFTEIICKKLQSILLSTHKNIYVFGFKQFGQYENVSPEDQILIKQMIDKRHPLITFPDNKSDTILSLPMLALSKLWLKFASVSSSECLQINELKNRRNKFGSLQELRNI